VVVREHPDHVVELYDVEPSTSDQDLVSLLFDASAGDRTQQARNTLSPFAFLLRFRVVFLLSCVSTRLNVIRPCD
jgi:hypothetical protein